MDARSRDPRGKGPAALRTVQGDKVLCLAGVDHLVFHPAGDALRMRRARSTSAFVAHVVRFSHARKRWEARAARRADGGRR